MNNRIKIVEYKENWSEYTLENGTIIRLKPVVTDIILKDKKKMMVRQFIVCHFNQL